MTEDRRSPLHDWHVAHGADLLWEDGYPWTNHEGGDPMAEYEAIRTATGIWDLFSTCKYEVTGPDAGRLIQRRFTNSLAGMADGAVRYGAFVNADGTMVDDGNVYRFGDDRYWVLINSAGFEDWFTAASRVPFFTAPGVVNPVHTRAAVPDRGLAPGIWIRDPEAILFKEWARELARGDRAKGVYVLICMNPGYTEVLVDEETLNRGFTHGKASELHAIFNSALIDAGKKPPAERTAVRDAALLAALLYCVDSPLGAFFGSYLMLITAVGLAGSTRLIAWTTACCSISYLILLAVHPQEAQPPHYIVLALVNFVLVGLAVGYQVWRMSVLREYYGDRN